MVLALACIATWRSHESHDAKAETTPVVADSGMVGQHMAEPIAYPALAVPTLRPVEGIATPSVPEATVSAAAVGTLTAIESNPVGLAIGLGEATESRNPGKARATDLGPTDAGVLSSEALDALLSAAGWPSELQPSMKAIVLCEDPRLDPEAKGDSGNSLGLAQLWTGWFRDGEDPFDPLTNLSVAFRVLRVRGHFGGVGGWTCADRLGIP